MCLRPGNEQRGFASPGGRPSGAPVGNGHASQDALPRLAVMAGWRKQLESTLLPIHSLQSRPHVRETDPAAIGWRERPPDRETGAIVLDFQHERTVLARAAYR